MPENAKASCKERLSLSVTFHLLMQQELNDGLGGREAFSFHNRDGE
jgi:hypothetical protein